jgi:hypothetical protein
MLFRPGGPDDPFTMLLERVEELCEQLINNSDHYPAHPTAEYGFAKGGLKVRWDPTRDPIHLRVCARTRLF